MPNPENQSTDHGILLRSHFRAELDRLALQLVQGFNLKLTGDPDSQFTAGLRWMDFRLRYIDPKPRAVLRSDKFPKTLPPAIAAFLIDMEARLVTGDDVNSHQGKGLTIHGDIGGANRARRTDLLWADWGFHHLHLSAPGPLDPDGYAPRSDWLLFVSVYDNAVLFLDVLPHDTQNFSEHDLVATMFSNWPETQEAFQIQGMFARDPATPEL